MWLLVTLFACGSPPASTSKDTLPARVEVVDLAVVEAWMHALDLPPERVRDVLRVGVPRPEGQLAVSVQVDADAKSVILAAGPIATLDTAQGTRAVAQVLTEIAVRNFALVEGKLQLDPDSGQVLISMELETDEGLGRATFEAALRTLVTEAGGAEQALARALAP